jgi:predicted DNA-binding transcriptional regulator YafY
MQINRLFEMVYLLMGRKDQKKMTAKELADHFEVSQRTVYRDIEILNGAGIPVSANKGKGGGIELSGKYLLEASAFSERERSEIIFALQSFRALKYVNADNVLKKLSAVFNKDTADWIEVDFSDWTPEGPEKFNIMKTAVVYKKCLSFDYFDYSGEKTHRTVYPLQLWFKHRDWYIKAFCLMRRDYRLFKISRVKNVTASESNFEVTDLFGLEAFHPDTRNSSGEFFYDYGDGDHEEISAPIKQPEIKTEPAPEPEIKSPKNNVDLKLLVDAAYAHRIFDEFEEENISTDANGNYIINAVFPDIIVRAGHRSAGAAAFPGEDHGEDRGDAGTVCVGGTTDPASRRTVLSVVFTEWLTIKPYSSANFSADSLLRFTRCSIVRSFVSS